MSANGVNLAFSGHAHIYQRKHRSQRARLVSYVTGGGGAQAQSTGTCSGNDKYAVGWSYTNDHGTACGPAATPTSDAQVYHFLKVTVNGAQVTVTPTDSTGRTFDVQTYTFKPKPDTFIDSSPPVGYHEQARRRSASTRAARRPRSAASSTAAPRRAAPARSPTPG